MSEKRAALIIGNSNYSHAARLRNPINDATALAKSIGRLGFTLTGGGPLLDASKADMEKAIRDFTLSLDRNTAAFFYFSGHGLQLGGANYMIPIEAGGVRETHIEGELVDAQLVLSGMERSGALINVIVLDACRNDPFEGRSYRSTTGLLPMQAGSGTILAFATQPGNIALDGAGNYSPYMEAWLEVLEKPGLDAHAVLNQVGVLVRQRTAGKQVPWMSSSPLERPFYFNLVEPVTSAAVASAGSDDEWWKEADAPVTPTPQVVAPSAGSIQSAIDAAPDGATIRLAPGRHAERLVITKEIELMCDQQCELVAEEGEEPLITLRSGALSLRGITLISQSGIRTISIYSGTLMVEDCMLIGEQPLEVGRTVGIDAAECDAEVELRNSIFEGFTWPISASGTCRLNVDGGEIRPRSFAPADNVRSLVGVFLGEKAKAEVTALSITGYAGSIHAMGQATGVFRNCTLEFSSYGAQALESSVLTIIGSKRIAGGEGAYGAWAHGGTIQLSGCRIFGGKFGVTVDDAGTLTAQSCEIFDNATACADGGENSTLTIMSCDLHNSSNHGVWTYGPTKVLDSKIYNHSSRALCFAKESQFEVSDCFVYQNEIGIFCEDQCSGTIRNTTVVNQKLLGIGAYNSASVVVENTIVRQTGNSAVYQCSDRPMTLRICDLARNPYPAAYADGTSKIVQASVVHPVQTGCLPQQGTGGRYNSIANSEFYYLPFNEAIDFVESWARTNLREWSWQPPETSRDGKQVTFCFERSYLHFVQLEASGWAQRIQMGIIGYQGTERIDRVNLPYEFRITVRLSLSPFVTGFDRVDFYIEEEEYIDRYAQTQLAIGNGWNAESHLLQMQLGCRMLWELMLKLNRP